MPNPQELPAADDVGAIIARMKEKHTDCSPAGSYRVVCRECDQQWPCDVSQLAAHVEALQAEIEAVHTVEKWAAADWHGRDVAAALHGKDWLAMTTHPDVVVVADGASIAALGRALLLLEASSADGE